MAIGSEQGERARQTLAEGGAVEAIAAAISRLSLHAPLPGGDDGDSQPQGRLKAATPPCSPPSG